MTEEVTAGQVNRKINKIVSFVEDSRKEVRALEETIKSQEIRIQQLNNEVQMLKSQVGAALAMRGHGATT